MKWIGKWVLIMLVVPVITRAQLGVAKTVFTRADTLRGSITEFRKGWDVLRYDLTVQPDINSKTLTGKNTITYYESLPVRTMQIDLQQPLVVDSIVGNDTRYTFRRDGDFCFVKLKDSLAMYKFSPGVRNITIYYSGTPREAKRAPWDGGLVWKTDVNGNPWVATACQGLGASAWWPCKDHQSDEPDSGMVINLVAPDTLAAISNGRLLSQSRFSPGLSKWTWVVKNPINSYGVTMDIGKYDHWEDTLMGEGGKLDLQYWVLTYNLDKAKKQFEQVKPMIRSHEYWFGKYPFYEDSYKLVEVPFLGMEHQSAVAYGNGYQNGYSGSDRSGTGWGMKWDFIIIHESGHEWFGNNITSKDIADMWVHEGFTNYSEVLYTEKMFGKPAASDYCYGIRKTIRNDRNIIGFYGVNKEGSSDMYSKGAEMLQAIRNTINDDNKFRSILRGLNSTFYHKTVTSAEIESYISKESKIDLSTIFDQYLRTTTIPVLEYYFTTNSRRIYYRWNNCVSGFNLPIYIQLNNKSFVIKPTETWQNTAITGAQTAFLLPAAIEKAYYVEVRQVEGKH